VRLLAPFLSFTTDEVWGELPKPAGSPDSVHLALFPDPSELTLGIAPAQRERLANWDKLMAVRDEVLKALEVARQVEKKIGKPLEAQVILTAPQEVYPLLQEYLDDLPAIFIVSQVVLKKGDTLSVAIERAEGDKCERCWKYTNEVGQSTEFPTLCEPCQRAVREILGD